jgi:RimK family alpha-L-glutamate ligase
MRIAILTGGSGWHAVDLLRAAAETGDEARVVDFRSIGSDDLSGFDAVIVRSMPPGSLEQIVFRMDCLHALQSQGIPILNPPRALETCIDKFLCQVRLERAGLRVPRSIVCQSAESAIAAFETLGRDVVVKPIFGSEGRGMIRVTDPEIAWRTFHAIERTGSVLFLQSFVPHPGWDYRAFVLHGRVVAAMQRTSAGDWRTNVAQGATATPVTLEPPLQQMAIEAAAAVGTIAAGVDLICDLAGNWYVLEVNAVPGWKALAPTTGVDIARLLIEACHRPATPEVPIGTHLHLACLWEATARKAGNVHPEASFADLTYRDFLLSAAVAAPELALAPTRPLGETILAAITATRQVVGSNTNLGIVLLLAPLAKATGELRAGVASVLRNSTVADSARIFEAIRRSSPGGLGKADRHDVRDAPTLPIPEIMKFAADRDTIARQYASDFADLFDVGVPGLLEGMARYHRLEPAIRHAQLVWMSRFPDSLIARKLGIETATEAGRRATAVLTDGGVNSIEYQEFDALLREEGHARNPGTTADLICASLYVALRQGAIATETPW